MSAPRRPISDRLVLSPREPLIAGGAAEAFERHAQQLFGSGYRHLILNLSEVSSIDDAGIRALVRSHTTAQRIGGSLSLAAVQPAVSRMLELMHLERVFDFYPSVEAARRAKWPWRTIRIAAAGALLCGALVWMGLTWPMELAGLGSTADSLLTGGARANGTTPHRFQPFVELLKLVVAALVGLLITAIHRPKTSGGSRSIEQAQTLLCISGAMMMIIIGNSLARAFGIAGAASIVRFRTPVDDPKDVTILFLLMGLGMSAGLGAFAVTGLATAFLFAFLQTLELATPQQSRVMSVEVLANGRQFPTSHVEGVFARNQIVFEPREISQSDDVSITYRTWLYPRTQLEDITAQLMANEGGVKSVGWEHSKRERI